MTMRPPIYEWYGRHPEVLDDLSPEELAWLLGESDVEPDTLKDWSEEDHPRVPGGTPEGGEWTQVNGEPWLDQHGKGKRTPADAEFGTNDAQWARLRPYARDIYLGNLSHAMQERIADAVEDVYKSHPQLGSLVGLFVSPDRPVSAHYVDNRIIFNPDHFKTVGKWEKEHANWRDARDYWLKAHAKFPEGVAKAELDSILAKRKGIPIPYLATKTVEGTVRHELGHHVHHQLAASPSWSDARKDLKAAKARFESKATWSVSEYARKNFNEYVAENFAVYRGGESRYIDPDLARAFRRLTRKP